MRDALMAVMICLAAACGFAARASETLEPLRPTRVLEVDPPFLETDKKDKKEIAEDLSGAACAPSGLCLAINDENRAAQFFTIDDGRIKPGRPVRLIGEHSSAATLGAKPEVSDCPGGDGGFENLDGEAVVYAKPYFYVVGSHGCSRKEGEFLLSSFILARFPADGAGASTNRGGSRSEQDASVETTYRLADALQNAPIVEPFFGKSLEKKVDGLNIEGLAIVGNRLFAGLRAPSIKGEAFLVSAPVDRLFAPGHEPLDAAPEVIPLALGSHVGIRDLAALSDGRLLVLAGPTQEQEDIPFSLFVVEPKAGGAVEQIAILDDVRLKNKDKRAKAEAVTILDPEPLRLLIFFDGPSNGEPSEYIVK